MHAVLHKAGRASCGVRGIKEAAQKASLTTLRLLPGQSQPIYAGWGGGSRHDAQLGPRSWDPAQLRLSAVIWQLLCWCWERHRPRAHPVCQALHA